MNNFEELKGIVRLVLNSWPSYQFAIKNQLGGSETFAKDEWFCGVISEQLFKKPDIYVLELSEWVEEIIYSEFDTICDDGTLEPTAKLLLQMSSWLLGRSKASADDAKQKLDENIKRLNEIVNKKTSYAPPQKAEESSASENESDDDT